jgi:hypothetical protein
MISSNENYFLEKQTNNDKRYRSTISCTAVLSIEIQFMYTKGKKQYPIFTKSVQTYKKTNKTNSLFRALIKDTGYKRKIKRRKIEEKNNPNLHIICYLNMS